MVWWWGFSATAQQWRLKHSDPLPTAFAGSILPRTNVCWFDAVAFCRWLSKRIASDYLVTLPTEQQWQRAAQGNDKRTYPWGSDYDPTFANTLSSEIKRPTPVTDYVDGVSPFGVMDMCGNVFEWCLSNWSTGSMDLDGDDPRSVRGGSWSNYYYVGRCDRRHMRPPFKDF